MKTRFSEAYEKALKVISSCQTKEQLIYGACRYIQLIAQIYDDRDVFDQYRFRDLFEAYNKKRDELFYAHI